MKQFLKFSIFLQVLVVLIYGCTWVVLKLTGQECPIIVLPITMAIVFGVELLTVFIVAPLAERWLD